MVCWLVFGRQAAYRLVTHNSSSTVGKKDREKKRGRGDVRILL